MTKDEYDRLRTQIERKHRRDLERDLTALDRLWRRLQDTPAKPTKRATLELTRAAAGFLREDFDVHAVLEKIAELKPEARVTTAAVSVALQRLAMNADPDALDRGTYLELVAAGGPRRAAAYRVRREPVTVEALTDAPF
jgi:hypothetical protein